MKRIGQRAERTSAEEVLALWEEYQQTGEKRLRDRLIFTFAPMVRYIVYRKVREVPAHCDVEDLLSCGIEALIRSVDRYDPEKGATLEQYAWTRVHGAVLDELRRLDWAPRSLRRVERTISSAQRRFIAEHGREPSRAELADAAGIDEAELSARIDELALAEVSSLNTTIRSEDSSTIERIDTVESHDEAGEPGLNAERRAAKERFRKAFGRLSEREQTVAVLLYAEGKTLNEIGERLGVSESRVSQIHSELRRRLREHLQGDESLFKAVA
ncbi:MAG TPA: FliA/WhiG family RNA polymerase sigma factor [Solirubrobacteraceae bacterium]|nr:FliA/WhiG family RNA polymerase sigma factor [Solirubrobacteraceae bacterium]